MKRQSVFTNSKKKGGEKMKKVLMLIALVVLFAMPAMAGIKASRHNLGTTRNTNYLNYKSSNETQICVFCHTPHNATQNIPLWNRNNPTTAFKMYTGSATLNMGTANKGAMGTKSISRFCLSCHDGVTGLGSAVVNQPNGAITMNGSGKIGGKANLGGSGGADLTNDHPVNLAYDVARNADTKKLNGPASTLVGVVFFRDVDATKGSGNDMLECATCHAVHGAGFPKFLRKSNASSSLCLTCHLK